MHLLEHNTAPNFRVQLTPGPAFPSPWVGREEDYTQPASLKKTSKSGAASHVSQAYPNTAEIMTNAH